MKRSEINELIFSAEKYFLKHSFYYPKNSNWDVTDFGLGNLSKFGLVLINLCNEPEYCEKLMYSRVNMVTPAHCHKKKKEDIICRWGMLKITFWNSLSLSNDGVVKIKKNNVFTEIFSGESILLKSGDRVTIFPETVHSFVPISQEVIIGEVSTFNDDLNDNFFSDINIGRFPEIEEDID